MKQRGARSEIAIVVRVALLSLVMGLVGWGGPGRIQYDGGRCLEDGRPLTAQQVESEQAEVTRRIASRQPPSWHERWPSE